MTLDDLARLLAAVDRHRADAEEFLIRLIGFPSTPGLEEQACAFLAEQFAAANVHVEKITLSDKLRDDEDYSTPIPDLHYAGRHNLRLTLPGRGDKTVVFNTHMDVVPAAEEAFHGYCENGIVYGRGACDAKGQIATLYVMARALAATGVKLPVKVVIHLVVEEECGGNGTLAMIRRGEQADAAIVLEPTGLRIFTSVRGAVWFRLTCRSAAGHSGVARNVPTALELAVEAMQVLRDYHKQLLAASKGIPLFDAYENPMPLTIGQLNAGRWPASRPEEATLAGVLGLLPNKTRYQVMEEMRQALKTKGSPSLADSHGLEFTYRHDANVLNPEHVLPRALLAACAEEKAGTKIDCMTASCDAWLYNNQLEIPTVVMGPGDLKYAHSLSERIGINEILQAARVLLRFLVGYS